MTVDGTVELASTEFHQQEERGHVLMQLGGSPPTDGGSEAISVGYIISLFIGFMFGWFWAALVLFMFIKISGGIS